MPSIRPISRIRARARTRTHLLDSNESERIYDPIRSTSRIRNARRIHEEFPSSSARAARTHKTRHGRNDFAATAIAAEDAPELSFIISPGQVGSAGIMQLFRCHNLKSWSIRPRRGRNQRRPGVTGVERGGEGLRNRVSVRDDAFSRRAEESSALPRRSKAKIRREEKKERKIPESDKDGLIARRLQFPADCSDPNCSGHGACVSGKCYCKAGWQGERCNQVDQQVYQCLPGCSDHGTYDLESAACICEEHWTGVDCSQPSCGLDCGPHGSCEQGRCKSVYTPYVLA